MHLEQYIRDKLGDPHVPSDRLLIAILGGPKCNIIGLQIPLLQRALRPPFFRSSKNGNLATRKCEMYDVLLCASAHPHSHTWPKRRTDHAKDKKADHATFRFRFGNLISRCYRELLPRDRHLVLVTRPDNGSRIIIISPA